jgi:hypothetical protein
MALINKAALRRLALDLSKQHRRGKFTRVSKEFVDRIEARLILLVHDEVKRHPTLGVTLK